MFVSKGISSVHKTPCIFSISVTKKSGAKVRVASLGEKGFSHRLPPSVHINSTIFFAVIRVQICCCEDRSCLAEMPSGAGR